MPRCETDMCRTKKRHEDKLPLQHFNARPSECSASDSVKFPDQCLGSPVPPLTMTAPFSLLVSLNQETPK